jgi:bifunctional DNA-binding transcriptional regulator/antitoxin component of YhaV-PrlF toxin-antitoxin module
MTHRTVKVNQKIIKTLEELKKLQTFDSLGRIYIPKHIRDRFRDCRFYIDVIDDKIVLDPVKIEYTDDDEKENDSESEKNGD